MTQPGPDPEYLSERLDPSPHDTGAFRCGEPELEAWLRDHAEHAGRMNTARTFVWFRSSDAEPHQVLGYYALAAHVVAAEDAPRSVARGGPRQLPAVLLAKLALATDLQGSGLGAQLLIDALRRAVAAHRHGPAARVMVVDALHDRAAGFYARYGFQPLPGNALRLIQKLSDIEAAVLPNG